MREHYYQIRSEHVYNRRYSLNEVYNTNQFPKLKGFNIFRYEQFEPYDYHTELEKHKDIAKLDKKEAAHLIIAYLSNKTEVPLKPRHKPAQKKKSSKKSVKQVVPEITFDNMPYFFNYIIQEKSYSEDKLNDKYPLLINYIGKHIPPTYGTALVFYYLLKNGYLLRNKNTPVNFPTQYSLSKDYFRISITKKGVYKVRLTTEGQSFINKIIETIPDWIEEVPTRLSEHDQTKTTIDYNKIPPYEIEEVMSCNEFLKKFKNYI